MAFYLKNPTPRVSKCREATQTGVAARELSQLGSDRLCEREEQRGLRGGECQRGQP